VFEQEATGPLSGGPHRWSTEHSEYNDAVKEHLEKFLERNKLAPEQMMPDHARQFATEIKTSSDPRIRAFNMRIMMREIMFQLRSRGRGPWGGRHE
jgi:hypothetical protein